MSRVVQKRWAKLFVAVSVLMLTQVAWWLDVFSRNVSKISELQKENATLRGVGSDPEILAQIQSAAHHKQLMFISETLVFAALTTFGLFLLFRALRMQEKARELQKQFIETMTHESKTPLTALKLRLESVLEKNQQDLKITKDLSQALEEVRRLISVFEKALHLNRMENARFRFEALSMTEVVQDVCRRMDPLFKEKKVKLSLDLAKESWVKGDRDSLSNTVQCLLENAVLYNDKGEREVGVSLKETSGKMELRVTDNGPGILASDRKRIFDKFFRGKSARRFPGTGLGLYLACHVVQSHQGEIFLDEGYQAPSGSCFVIILPSLGEKSV